MSLSPTIPRRRPGQSDDASSDTTRSSLLSVTATTGTTRSQTPTIFHTPTQHSQLIEQCRIIVETTKTISTSIVSGTDDRERLIIEELRFQARALHTSSKHLLACLQKDTRNCFPALEQDWTQLQEISGTLLSNCLDLLHLIDTTSLNGRTLSGDHGTRLFKFKYPTPPKAVPSMLWDEKDSERIKDLVCYRIAIQCLPPLNFFLARINTGQPIQITKACLARLKDQVCNCVFPPASFHVMEVPQEQNWETWFDSPNRYSNFLLVHFTQLAYKIYDIEWTTDEPDSNADSEIGFNTSSQDNSQVHLTPYPSPYVDPGRRPSELSAESHVSVASSHHEITPVHNTLIHELPSIEVNRPESDGSGNGAPDEDASPPRTSSPSTAKGPSSPTFDLGQQIQSLLQQQLTQDQKEKESLQQRVLQLEERCKIAEQKAEDEKQRAKKVTLEADRAEQERSELHEQVALLEAKCLKANQTLEAEKKVSAEQMKAMEKYVEDLKEYYEPLLNSADQQKKELTDQVKRLKKQMMLVQKITSTWKFEDIEK